MATNPYVKFKRGLQAALPSSIVDGTLYLTTDEGAIYLDNENSRVRLGDVVAVQNIAALPENGPVYQAANGMIMYYAKDENVLARWNGSGWTQINAAGLTKVLPSGSGNGVASVDVDPANSNVVKVTYTNFATKSQYDTLAQDVTELAEDLATLTGTGGSGSIADRIAAVQGDTDSTIADVEAVANQNQTDLSALTGRVTALDHTTTGRVTKVENDLSALQETVAGNHTAALNAAKAVQGETTKTVADVAAEVASNDSDISGLTGRMTAVEGVASKAASDISFEAERALAAEKAIQDELDATQGNVSADYNSLEKIEAKIKANAGNISSNDADILALQNALNGESGLAARVGANEDAIGLLNGAVTTAGSVKHTVAQEIAKVVGDGDAADKFDTIVEIATWLSEHETDALGMQNTITAQGGRITTLEGNLADLQETVAENASAAEDAVEDLKTELIGDAESYLTLGALEDAVQTAQTTATTAKNTANSNSTAINTANQNIAKNADDIASLTTTVANNKTAAETLVSDAKAEIKQTTDGLNTRLNTAESNITNLQGRMTTVETGVSTNADGVAENKAAITQEVNDRKAAITALETAYKAADTALTSRVASLESNMTTAQGNISDIFELLTWGSF